MKKILLLFLTATGLTAQTSVNMARFDHFTYQGHDPVYHEKQLTEGQYFNPILQGYYPDPSVCRKGNDYYLVNSTFSHYPGVPIFHSTDLVNWQQIGHVLNRPSQLNLDGLPMSYGIFAPAIEYNPFNDTFYMITTLVGRGDNFVVKAKDPRGPWSDPIWLPEVPGIDPSLFFDDNGKAYIVNNREPAYPALYSGHRAVWIHEYDVATDRTVGTPKVLIDGGIDISTQPQWIEGPHLYKIKGRYYLMAAEGGTDINHCEVILRADNPWGPFEVWDHNPILTQRDLSWGRDFPVTNAGHADLLEDHEGNWWSVFLACRPYRDNLFNIGRETFLLPVTWEDGWPVILKHGLEIPQVGEKQGVRQGATPEVMPNGNFTITDNFDAAKLAMTWLMIRTPHTPWHKLQNGQLEIACHNVSINEKGNPAFVARRQQHHHFTATTRMSFKPGNETENAGLVCFQNENHYYYLGVYKKGKQQVVRLTKGLKEQKSEVLAEIPIGKARQIDLRVTGEGALMHFAIATRPGKWTEVARDVDATYLSTSQAGGFVGTVIGMYAAGR
ncbi:alpha-N-arabinofuranosidase [Breznakibacter xylanolyticus]|uniref:Alpha-N-arabinofuranosidase n=1 Tax=Breznakibacter xylanolyticus TaxID=990 RepID=A0A2W7NKK1_9BACT|nr:glycoside hydrolase family 43 protein [Breznakibacter xylanolyticus]PZX18617.1 alpha-N-arabinofuranosidase [Breznakibacter xylanolyticus]